MPRQTVTIDSKFREYERHLDRGIQRALGHTAAVTVAAAKAAGSTSPYRIGGILSTIHGQPVQRFARGFVTYVGASDFRAVFFESGTYAKRGARRSTRGRAGAAVDGNRGVKPQRFMRKGARAARAVMLAYLARELGRW
jgi:hypothetical protein